MASANILVDITESVGAELFNVLALDVLFGRIASQATTDALSVLDLPLVADVPVYLVVVAEQGLVWKPLTTYSVGDVALPDDPSVTPYCFKVQSITTGTTGGSEPLWPTTPSGTVVDAGVVWENVWRVVPPKISGPFY